MEANSLFFFPFWYHFLNKRDDLISFPVLVVPVGQEWELRKIVLG